MKIISQFVRNGSRYNPGDFDKINPSLTDAEIQRLTKAGCLADGDDKDQASNHSSTTNIPASRTEMRTEAGEAAHREADARAREKAAAPDIKPAKATLTLPTSAAAGGGDDGLAGRTKSPQAQSK